MSSLKILTAAIAAAAFSLAHAQATPPKPATDPAMGAGQQSTQSTPMGATGTSVLSSAVITRYSRSTWCAEATSWPGGFLRSTKLRRLPSSISAERKKVGLE